MLFSADTDDKYKKVKLKYGKLKYKVMYIFYSFMQKQFI
jgi:hypothetical protein